LQKKLNEIGLTVGASASDAASKVRELQTDFFETRAELTETKGRELGMFPEATPPGLSSGGPIQDIQRTLASYYRVSTRLDETDFIRTPHMDAPSDRALNAGEDFDVCVYLDQDSPHPGEEGSLVVVPGRDLPDVLQFSVWLDGSPSFEILGHAVQSILISRRENRSTEAIYRVHVREDSQDLTNAKLTASFSYNQLPAGFVSRRWQGPTSNAAAESHEFLVRPRAKSPDLKVEIHTIVAGQYKCTVSTPHLTNYDHEPQFWPLNPNPDDFVKEHIAEFTENKPAKDKLVSLRVAGIAFYDAAPKNFKTLLWELIKRNLLSTIYICTDEPTFPWELMIPYPEDDPTAQRTALGAEFTVGRWITDKPSPPQEISISTAFVMTVPFHDEEADTLAAEEATQILTTFHGEPITPATRDKLDEMLISHPPDLLHFVCHGKSGVGHGRQVLEFERSSELDSTMVPVLDGFKSFFKPRPNRPVVFLNACEVGSLEPALVGVGGFPQVFAGLRAGAIIAPLWSVKHTAAHKAAHEFYDSLNNEPMIPMATMIRDIRKKAYETGPDMGEDSYAAYCFYGDPLSVRQKVLLNNTILVSNSEHVPALTTETTSEATGTVTEYSSGSTIVLKETSGPQHYRFGKTVTYVTRSGKVLDEETVKARAKVGVPVRVHYTGTGDNVLVDRVILDED
jgi:hypothetical protein